MKAKRTIAILMAIICTFCSLTFSAMAEEEETTIEPSEGMGIIEPNDEIMASGLIYSFFLYVEKKNSTTLSIYGETDCDPVVVKCGFKNLKVQRRANSSSSWSDYYSYGNIYNDSFVCIVGRNLTVDPGYQYRVTCKHFAKKNILNTQSINNASNIVTF